MSASLDKSPLLTVCMFCRRETDRNRAMGEPLPPAGNHSHGVCIDCAPGYMREASFTEGEISEFLATLACG